MAITQQSTIVGIFQDRAMAEQAVTALKQAGFGDEQIEFAGQGTATGGLLGSLKSLFTGQDAGNEHVYDDLVGIGMPAEDARYYQGEYEAGRGIVAVTGDGSDLQKASSILTQYGGYDASRRTAQTSGSATAGRGVTSEKAANTEGEQRFQLREERLRVYKRPVQVGEVGVRKEVVAQQQTLNVPVTHEEVYIERRPVDQPFPSDTPMGDRDQVIRVPVSEERVNANKRTVVREEVELGKRVVQDTQQVRDNVRREEAHIEREGDVPIHGTKTDPFHPSQADPEDLLKDS